MQNYINYFTEIEEHFQRRRGSILLLSTVDWALIDTWREAGVPLEAVLQGHFPWCASWEEQLRALFAGYVEAKQAQGVLDYDDLLLYWAQMMSDPGLAGHIGERFDHVLVDEYQDTNRLQSSILLALKPGGDGLTVVGDDAQSIYAFRAATVRNLQSTGYTGYTDLIMEPVHAHYDSAADFKAPQRAHIEDMGYTIIANVGDQPSDLDGGFSEQTYLLPNPFYRIP